jgi:hypothetical protein
MGDWGLGIGDWGLGKVGPPLGNSGPPLPQAFKGRDFVFGNFLTISADLKILKQPNHVKHLRIFSTIFEILKTLPLKGPPSGDKG